MEINRRLPLYDREFTAMVNLVTYVLVRNLVCTSTLVPDAEPMIHPKTVSTTAGRTNALVSGNAREFGLDFLFLDTTFIES
jgi:hypothetical protein